MNGSAGWLESEELDVLLLPLLVAMQRKLPTEVLCTDEAACAQRCAKAFLAVKVSPTQQSCAPSCCDRNAGTDFSHQAEEGGALVDRKGRSMKEHGDVPPAGPEGHLR